MLKCLICSKYIYLYIYISLFHFVVNEQKFLLRYNGGQLEWELTLDLNTIGGQVLSNRLNEKKKIELAFTDFEGEELTKDFDENFSTFYENELSEGYVASNGDIVAFRNHFSIYLENAQGVSAERIGHVNDFSYSDLKALIGNSETVNLEFVLKTEKPDTSKKVTEINKK